MLSGNSLTQGPAIESFEEALAAYVGAKFAVAVSSGTAALHLAALAAGAKDPPLLSLHQLLLSLRPMLRIMLAPKWC